MTGDATVHGSQTVEKDQTVKGDSTIEGSQTINQNQTVKGDSHVYGTSQLDKDVTIGTQDAPANLDVTGNAFVHQNIGVGGNAVISGNTLIGENLRVEGTISAGGVISAPDAIIAGKSLNNELHRMESAMNGIGASAAALAALEYDAIEEGQKWQIAGGVGNHSNKTAYALGVKYHPNKDISFHFGTTIGSTEKMINAGFSIALGHAKPKVNKNYEEEMETLKKAVYILSQQNAILAAQVGQLSEKLVIDPNKREAFEDVPADHWASEAVETLKGNQAIQGYPDGKFHGEQKMSRYEYAQMLYNALKNGTPIDQSEMDEYSVELAEILQKFL